MRVTLELLKKKARSPQNLNTVPFQELLPLKLRRGVSGKGDKTQNVACMHELSVVFACLKDNEFDQSLCNKEISSLNTCYKNHLEMKAKQKIEDEQGVIVAGAKNINHKQLNKILAKYPTGI